MQNSNSSHTSIPFHQQALFSLNEGSATNTEYVDHIVQLVAGFFRVPIATVVFVNETGVQRQASVGMDGLKTHVCEDSMRTMALSKAGPLVVEDTLQEGLTEFTFLSGEAGLRFFASVPLTHSEGRRVGALYIGDKTPRLFSNEHRLRLEQFAQLVVHELEMKEVVAKRTTELADKEQQLKDAFAMAAIGAWEFDLRQQKAVWSEELFTVYGLKKTNTDQNLLDLYLSLLHPEDLPVVMKELADPHCIADTAVNRLLRPDGSLGYVYQLRKKFYDEEGRLVKVSGISQDITAQTEYEVRLQNSEERFRALVQNGSDMTAVLDGNGNITYMSPTSLSISGFSPDELTGRNVLEFMHEDDIAVLSAELEKVAAGTNNGEPTLHRLRKKDGGWIWLESKGMNLMNNPAIGGIIINARDVTERKQLEERLAVEQQNRQRAITSAVIRAQEAERSQVGRELHDNVNQVLTTVKLYTEMMDEGIGDRRELVRKSRQHLQACIDEIRSISKRLSAPTLGEITLEDSIKELVESLNMTNRIEIVYCGLGLCQVQIAQDMHLAIYRIIQEQLNNILKYAAATQVNIFLRREGAELILTISDNGKGFDTAAKRNGIGITNMRTRAENLNGRFQITSEPGNGCQLQVRFPVREATAEATLPAP